MQGDPLAMVAYGIGIILLIKRLKLTDPDVTQPWYAYDAGALGTFNNMASYFNSLKHFGPGCGYYLKLWKITLIVQQNNLELGKKFGLRHGLKVCTGQRYLGSFIGDEN